MPKELTIYGPMYEFSAERFINSFSNISETDELVVRVNSQGGEVESGWGMIARFKEFEGKKTVKIDGKAHSMAFNFALYADEVQALDVSRCVIHRAAYPSWIESNAEYFTEDRKKYLEGINSDLKAALVAKVGNDVFKNVTGKTINEVFDMGGRLDILVNAKQLKEMGIISKIVRLTPEKRAKIEASMMEIAAFDSGFDTPAILNTEENDLQIENNSNMNIQELKEKHPALYASVFEAGEKAGKEAESDRVGAWATFNDVDPVAVKAGIESGKNLSQKDTAEFTLKAINASTLKKIEGDNPAADKTDTTSPEALTGEAKELADLSAKIDAELGLTNAK